MSDALAHQIRWYADEITLRGQVIVDVGANVGRLSRGLWDAAGGTSRLVSVEPLLENVERIRGRIPDGADWVVHQAAITASDGPVRVRVEPQVEGLNCVVDGGAGQREVPGRRLPALCPDATVVKLDVEGHEYAILDDALPSMAGVHSWAIEFHRVPDRPLPDALAALSRRGYRLRAAGRRAHRPDGPWVSVEIQPSLGWASIPVAERRPDGFEFKMLHVVARRPAAGA